MRVDRPVSPRVDVRAEEEQEEDVSVEMADVDDLFPPHGVATPREWDALAPVAAEDAVDCASLSPTPQPHQQDHHQQQQRTIDHVASSQSKVWVFAPRPPSTAELEQLSRARGVEQVQVGGVATLAKRPEFVGSSGL